MSAVVVEYNSRGALEGCVRSLASEGIREIVVVDNAATASRGLTMPADDPGLTATGAGVRVLAPGRNLGYGGGANAGVDETKGELVLVCNPDLLLVPGAVATLVNVLDEDRDVALVGPLLRDPSGVVFPSGRDFPSVAEALGHAFLGLVWGGNPWTRRYRHLGGDQHVARDADWVSGSIFLMRRSAFDSVGGFDERYFMYLEEVDLCWRLRRAGWRVRYEPRAEAVHEQGRSTSQHPYRMLAAHHRSMWLFAERSSAGRERLLLPLIALGLVIRLGLAWLEHLVEPRRHLLRLLGRDSRQDSRKLPRRPGEPLAHG